MLDPGGNNASKETEMLETLSQHNGGSKPCCRPMDHEPQSWQLDTMRKPFSSDGNQRAEPCRDIMATKHPSLTACYTSDDVESLGDREHITIEIQGSSCPGCISEVSKALESIPYLYHVRVQTIPLRAEFDRDVARTTIREVMRSVRTRTGRRCERVGDGWQKLQVTVPDPSVCLETSASRYGIMDIERLGDSSFSIKYDAAKIRARKLLKALETEHDCPVNLAPAECYDEIPKDVRRAGFLTCVSSILTLPILILAWAPLPKHKLYYDIASLVLATAVQIVVAGPFYPKALRSLFLNRAIDMDLLVVLSTSVTYTLSVASFICAVSGAKFTSGMYFETSTLLITLIMAGRLMADFAYHQVIKSRSIRSLQPQSACLLDKSTSEDKLVVDVDVRLLEYDDVIEIEPGCAAPTDGIVHSGESHFDESLLTGEANLVYKSQGCQVVAGSTNKTTAVRIRVTRLPGANSISDIADMVEEISRSKPKSQRIADEVACWIVPAIGTLALLTFLIWILIGKLVRNESAGSAILHAMPYAVSVLVVSCPCAIGLAIPIVQVVAGNVAAKYGLVMRTPEVMTRARKVNHVVFDKTGTLTNNKLFVLDKHYFSKPPSFVAGLTLALTRHSEHPVSSAIAEHLKCESVEPIHVTDTEEIAGKGIRGMLNGQHVVHIGSSRWLGFEKFAAVQLLLSKNLTVSCVAQGKNLIAVFGLQATIRPDAAELVFKLKERGVKISIMSGDEVGAVHKVAAELRIPLRDTWARCTPQEKQQHVKQLMQSQDNTVLFCGDGANDAAALSQASIGLHMSNGAGFADSAADAVITSTSLKGVLVLLNLSRHCFHQIVFGFSWSLFYNLFAIMLAAGLFIKVRLPPEYAGLGEAVSVLPVVIVPLRLKWKTYV